VRELSDCLLSRLRARHPGALVAHRLDLDTSGLVVAAKDRETHVALQQLFSRREVEKRYDAVLDGAPRGDRDGGVIELALRVDLDDRPRQIHDPLHGKPAINYVRGRIIEVEFAKDSVGKEEARLVKVIDQASGVYLEPSNPADSARANSDNTRPRPGTRPPTRPPRPPE